MSFGIPVRNGLAVGLLASTFLSSRRAAYPAMSLDFLQPFLDSRITFSRGSNATLVDATGKITYAPANLLLQSQTFDNASWSKIGATITADAAAAPDGTTTADALIEDTSTSDHITFQPVSFVQGTTYTTTVYAKANTRTRLNMVCVTGAVFQGNFDLSNGTVISTPSGTSAITAVGNGWYRCQMTATANATIAGNVQFRLINTGTTTNYTGDGTSGLFIWGAQTELVTYQTTPSTYVATTASAYYGPRFDYDPVTLAPKGLLIEEARTNIILQSQTFDNAAWAAGSGGTATVTANTTASPDGTVNADTMADTSAAAVEGRQQVVTITSGSGSYTASCFVKKNTSNCASIRVSLSGGTLIAAELVIDTANGNVQWRTATSGVSFSTTSFGSGWYRVSATITDNASGNNQAILEVRPAFAATYSPTIDAAATGSVYIYGAQLEAGSFATSYIPTVASTVTRSADVATMTGTNFSSWYNQSEGTFVVSQDNVGVSFRTAIQVDGGSNSNRILLQTSSTSLAQVLFVNVANVSQVNLSTQTINSTGSVTAAAYKLDDYAYSVNGAAASTDNVGLVPTVTRMFIGSEQGSSVFLNGHIRQIAYYNTRLPNAQLQTLTAPSLATTLSLSFTNQAYTVGV